MKSFILLMKKVRKYKMASITFSFLTLLFHFILSTQAHQISI